MVTVSFPGTTNHNGLPSGQPDLAASNGAGHDTPEMLQAVAEGAHQTIDRLAEQAAPHVQRLQETMAEASEMLDERTDQIRAVTGDWLEALRCTVRDNPLAAVGAALAVGLVVARLTR